MILYEGLITLDYEPATDILVTTMPDVTEFSLSEVQMCLDIIVSNIRNYDIKKLLLDSSVSVVEVQGEGYLKVVEQFSRDLMSTRLQKLARVRSASDKREERSAEVFAKVQQKYSPSIRFANFSTQSEAQAWLLEP